MIIQACLNGVRPRDFHPCLPLTAGAMARDGAACIAAGAGELHVHPRDSTGRERLASVGETVAALRITCPGTLIGVSTGAWIEQTEALTRTAIMAWTELPDYASVNLSEDDAPGVMERLDARRIGIEAGLASVADAERLVALGGRPRAFRILIEIEEQRLEQAAEIVDGIAAVLERAHVGRPVLLHGFDATVWPMAKLARERGWSARVGLEDGMHLPDGTVAPDNAALVKAAVALFRAG